jgi:hypothetical protein
LAILSTFGRRLCVRARTGSSGLCIYLSIHDRPTDRSFVPMRRSSSSSSCVVRRRRRRTPKPRRGLTRRFPLLQMKMKMKMKMKMMFLNARAFDFEISKLENPASNASIDENTDRVFPRMRANLFHFNFQIFLFEL